MRGTARVRVPNTLLMMKRQRKCKNQKVEECGIWLDTEELKRKRPKAHSISELLNPLSKNRYNIEISLNFTQTRAPQRCVKQTTVSSFFFPKSKGNPRSTAHTSNLQAVDHSLAALPFPSTSEDKTLKDQPEVIIDADLCAGGLDSHTQTDGREMRPTTLTEVCHSTVGNISPPTTTCIKSALGSDEQASQVLHRTQLPCCKADGVTSESQSSTPGEDTASVKGPIDSICHGFTQDSQGRRVISHRRSAPSAAVNSRLDQGVCPCADSETLCRESFGSEMSGCLTSTQCSVSRARGLLERKAVLLPKPDRGNSSFLNNKENIFEPMLSSFTGKRKDLYQPLLERTLMPFGNTSLLQCPSALNDKPVAFMKCRELLGDQCEVSDLFSQDSQGNRVISHRYRKNRILSEGHSGVSSSPHIRVSRLDHALCKSLSEDDTTFSPLFTQDSEGHVMIKHSSRAMY
ncbi:uncharacterized protein LOC132396378 isoform X2 [Hypanus sabinus]|uniref:uncharacterized protein LOC132396378 isoform X2 n=1 Tax=Hypanus sabinus TaxID=79690 RepID=UPI0028C465CF|nr:uncharacterized protein LOC132396378 isoform X2 [Hypanus sabinus]